MPDIGDLKDLGTSWHTYVEDQGRWIIGNSDPAVDQIVVIRRCQLAGLIDVMEFMCNQCVLFKITTALPVEMEKAHDFWDEHASNEVPFLSNLCMIIEELVRYRAANAEELAKNLKVLIQRCASIGLSPELRVVVQKSPLERTLRVGAWHASVWFEQFRFEAWLSTLTFAESAGFLFGTPKLIFLPERPEGAPPWILSIGEPRTEHQIQTLSRLFDEIQRSTESRRAELTSRSTGPVLTPSLLTEADVRWISRTPLFGPLVGCMVLCALATEYKVDQTLSFSLSLPDRVVHSAIGVHPDRLEDSYGETLIPTEEQLQSWLYFLKYYHDTKAEARRHHRLWLSALDLSRIGSGLAFLAQTEQLVSMFKALRDKLLDENLDKALTAAEKAQTVVNQLASQITKDVDALGSDVEKLAVASITSGLVGISGAVFKSDSIAIIGPIATALVFLWYFPLMFDRLQYLQDSIQRRGIDLNHAVSALRRAAGNLISNDEYIAQLAPHRDAAEGAIGKIRRHLIGVLSLLHVVASGVANYVLITRCTGITAFFGVGAVAVYTVVLLRQTYLPRSRKVLLILFGLVLPALVAVGLALGGSTLHSTLCTTI